METYLYNNISQIVDRLFEDLKANNINVELEKSQLSKKELKVYMKIYNEYKEKLCKLKDEAISKYGNINNFDYIYATMIQDIVTQKQKTRTMNT